MAPRGDDEAIKASEPPILDWSWLQSLNPKHLGKHLVRFNFVNYSMYVITW